MTNEIPKMKNVTTSEAYQIFFETLKLNDIDALVQAAHDIYNLPVVLTDENYRIISQHPKYKIGEEIYDSYLTSGLISNDLIKNYQLAYLKNKERYYTPFYSNTEYVKNSPRIFCEVFDEENVYGHIGIWLGDNECTKEALEIAQIFVDSLKILMRIHKTKAYSSYSIYLNDLLEKTNTYQLKEQAARNLTSRFPKSYVIMVTPLGERASTRALATMEINKISSLYRYIVSTIYKDNLVMLICDIKSKSFNNDLKDFFSRLQAEAIGKEYCSGISSSFTNLLEVYDRYIQAYATVQVTNKSISYYDEVYPKQLFTIMGHYINTKLLISKYLFILKDYDLKNKSEYFNTLRVFLYQMKDNNSTSSTLCIHRNTLLYRINKIEELLGITLDDNNSLALLNSYQIYDSLKLE